MSEKFKGKMIECSPKKSGSNGAHHHYEDKNGKTRWKWSCKIRLENGDEILGERHSQNQQHNWTLNTPIEFEIDKSTYCVGEKYIKNVKSMEQKSPEDNNKSDNKHGHTGEYNRMRHPYEQALIMSQSAIENAISILGMLPQEELTNKINNKTLSADVEAIANGLLHMYPKLAKKLYQES